MKPSVYLSTFAFSIFATAGCAPVVPHELADARTAYQHASASRAADLKPDELHKAKQALEQAEMAFKDEPKAEHTLDLAYVAQRKAQLAEALGNVELANRQKLEAEQSIARSEQAIQQRTKAELTQTKEQLAEAERQRQTQGAALGSERQARFDAEQRALEATRRSAEADARAKSAQEALSKVAMVKDEPRGMVITLSGSVLFASGQATLLPEAQAKLAEVAEALMSTKERTVVVEGHADARGSSSLNMELSQRRAEAVRSFLVSRGCEADKVQARGIGKDRPVASNASPEGRANNRRVEIIVEPVKY